MNIILQLIEDPMTSDISSGIGWLVWLLLFGIIAIIAIVARVLFKTDEERKEKVVVPKVTAKIDYHATAQVDGIQNSFKFIVDDVDKKVIILYPTSAFKYPTSAFKSIPYADIMGVEIIENGTTVFEKSMMRTLGGALIGDLIAGDAGMIVGGLSGSAKQVKKVSSITVVIKLRNLSEPSVDIVCFDAMEHVGIEEIDTNDDSVVGIEYREGEKSATRIAQLIGVIIDENDRQQKKQDNGSGDNKTESGNISDVKALEKLVSLKEKGLISEEEYSAMKAKIIK